MSAALSPPPAETLARVQRGTRLGLAPAGSSLHVLAGDVTRCGHRTSADWQAYGGTGARVPTLRLCARCAAGLPRELLRRLEPTRGELRRVYERDARYAAEDLRRHLEELRTRALVDGAAYEPTRLVEAVLPSPEVGRRSLDAARTTKAERNARVTGHVAAGRPLTLLELLNELDPTRPDLPGHRVWLVDEPELGTPVDVGGTYDARLWMGRRR